MNQERLSQMVVMLRGLPEDGEVKFNLEVWNCGTSTCAVGHACMNAAFTEQGLVWSRSLHDSVFEEKTGWTAVE